MSDPFERSREARFDPARYIVGSCPMALCRPKRWKANQRLRDGRLKLSDVDPGIRGILN